jgi:redox-sensing transcriptional repressor
MTAKEVQAIPVPTLRRLPSYLRFLKKVQAQGRDVVSCTHIADALGLDPTQVRKDLAVTGIVGKPRVGYHLPALVEAVETLLGWNNTTDALLVGAGSLGTALMGYEGFREYGLNIVAAFDVDPEKVGAEVHGRPVLHVDQLANLASRLHAHIGIITTPAAEAQRAADLMVAGGVRGIWNFAPADLEVPDEVILESVQLPASLAVLSTRLAAALREDEQGEKSDGSQ